METMLGMQADYIIHAGWGDHIEWWNLNQGAINFNTEQLEVHGHLTRIPRVGETLLGEFQKYWIKFEFVEVERPGDPPDQFFGKVKAIDFRAKITP